MENGPALRDRLVRLEEKYRTLAELRGRREAAERSGETGFAEGEVRARTAAFRAIAREFPGSLRELEHSTREQLEARRRAVLREIEAIENPPAGDAPVRAWVAVVLDYHALLREALAIKLWLARNLPRAGRIDEDLLQRFRAWHRACDGRHTPTAAFDVESLERYRRPPGGRLHALIWAALQRKHARERPDLEQLVFHPPA